MMEEVLNTMATTLNNILRVGTVLNDKWVILEFIGKGGMGEVYRAHQLNLKRDVAIKAVSQEWLESFDGDEVEIETGLQRFRREAEAMAQINHPNILRVYDHGSDTVQRGEKEFTAEYMAMEYMPGGTSRSTMSKNGFYPEKDLTREWIREFFLPVLDGVVAIHKAGIIHRDLKPENTFIDRRTPKIADFGLSCSSNSRPLTESVHVMGSPVYMSPEHFLDFKRADERADIYSLGKILFEAIEGKVSSETIPMKRASLSNAQTPFFHKLDRIIQDATAEDRENRLSSVEELRERLVEALADSENKQVATVKPLTYLHQKSVFWTIAAAILLVVSLVGFTYVDFERLGHRGPAQTVNQTLKPYPAGQPLQAPSS